MSSQTYYINNRPLKTCFNLQQELSYQADKNYLFHLDYSSALNVLGENSAEFLQGQLSCNLREVSSLQMRQAALCNLKGRVLALMDVINWDSLYLILPHDLLNATQHSLAKTAIFSKVTLSPASDLQLFGFYLQNTKNQIPFNVTLPNEHRGVSQNEFALCYQLRPNLYLFLVKTEHASTLVSQFEPYEQLRGSLAWHALQLHHKQFEIYPETRGIFLPHRLGLQNSGHLNFNKGCYKGQEIIARTHYRAKLKHDMKWLTIHTSEALQAGAKLFTTDGLIEVGELIDYCPIDKNSFLIAASLIFDPPNAIIMENHENTISLFI